MSLQTAAIPPHGQSRQGVYLPADTIGVALTWLTMATSGVVFFEPAPFDGLAMALVAILPLMRVVRVTPSLTLLLGMWLVIIAFSLLAVFDAEDTTRALKHNVITLYLAVAAVVIAGFVAANPARHGSAVMSGYGVAALVCTAAAILGYLGIGPGTADLFTEYGRGRGTFKDPNVYGAFLVPAILFALHNMMTRPPFRALISLGFVGMLVFGVLISYSRGAWANLAVALAVFGYLTFVTAPTVRRQLGLIVLGFVALGMMVGVLLIAAQFRETADFLSQRASFTQDYDVGSGGRFAGQLKALNVVIENPFGIGAREFGYHYHAGDVHNVYLSMFLNGGWIGGALYLTIVVATLLAGFVHSLKDTATRGLFIAVYAAFVATAGEGIIIDTDHWRHFFILLAVTWGLMAGTQFSQQRQSAAVGPSVLHRRLANIIAADRVCAQLEAQAPVADTHHSSEPTARKRRPRHGTSPWGYHSSRNDPGALARSRSAAAPHARNVTTHLRAGRTKPAAAARLRSHTSRRKIRGRALR